MDWITHYLGILLVTIAIEIPVAALLGLRKRIEIAAVALVTVFTFPILSLALALLDSLDMLRNMPYFTTLLVMEIVVALIEWRLLAWALRRERRMLLTSVVMNAASFLIGLFVLRV